MADPSSRDEAPIGSRTARETVEAWVDAHWDPRVTLAEWWDRLTDARYAAPELPVESGGLGASADEVVTVRSVLAARGCMGPPGGIGMMLAAPTIAAHGTPEQIEEFIDPILRGRHAWCQLFSEPNAGSDLAGLECKAVRDGDHWIITGQKVWTSGGKFADMGMLLARTDPDAPKRKGISWFAFPMDQPGVDVRPERRRPSNVGGRLVELVRSAGFASIESMGAVQT